MTTAEIATALAVRFGLRFAACRKTPVAAKSIAIKSVAPRGEDAVCTDLQKR